MSLANAHNALQVIPVVMDGIVGMVIVATCHFIRFGKNAATSPDEDPTAPGVAAGAAPAPE